MVRLYRSLGGREYVAIDHGSRLEFEHEGRRCVNFERCRMATNEGGPGRPSAVKAVVASGSILDGLVEVERGEVPAEWLTWLDGA